MLKEIAKHSLLLIAGVLLGLSLGSGPGTASDPESVLGPSDGEVADDPASTMLDFGGRVVVCSEQTVKNEATVWQLLEACAARRELELETESYGELGLMVTAIDGRENGREGRYWQYWVNNQYAIMGSQDRAVDPGDVILWNYTSAKE